MCIDNCLLWSMLITCLYLQCIVVDKPKPKHPTHIFGAWKVPFLFQSCGLQTDCEFFFDATFVSWPNHQDGSLLISENDTGSFYTIIV